MNPQTKQFKLSFTLAVFLFMAMIMTSIAQAADNASVTASVTALNLQVSVASGSVTYGIMGLSSTKSTIASDLNSKQTATNDGNGPETIKIAGTDSAGWTLGAVGSNTYSHKFCVETGSVCNSPPTSYTSLTTSNQTLKASVAALGTVEFQLQLGTPSSSTAWDSQSVNVNLLAVVPGT